MNMKTIEHNDKEIDMWYTPAHTYIYTNTYSYQHFIIAVQLSIKNNSIEHFFYSVFQFYLFFLGQRKKATWKISHARWGDIFHGERFVNLLACVAH